MAKPQFIRSFLLVALLGGCVTSAFAGEAMIPLAGTWRFRLDPENMGVAQKWYALEFEDSVRLPGTTDENHKGVKKDEQCVDRLSRVWYWKGPAWYQRRVTIPDTWTGKRITLLLERSKNTRVWVDQAFCGGEDTLSAPQWFDVSAAMTPGAHMLTVLVDNAKLPPVGPAHAVDERTQTNWNGIIGRIELCATAPVWLDDVQVYPDVNTKRAVVRAVIGNVTGKAAAGRITIQCESYHVARPATFATKSIDVKLPRRQNAVEFSYQPGDVPLWDEFRPAMLRLKLKLEATAGGKPYRDEQTVNFGMRDFSRQQNRLTINGRPVFLRGKLDCCLFPLTGYPPMDEAAWLRVLSIARSYGINHYRFHSWCPPEAAFAAADELGMYLQVELPNKRSAFDAPESKEAAKHNIDYLDVDSGLKDKSLYEYASREGELIFRAFGNHPSFVMFTLGNELGRNPGMFQLVSHFRKCDPRHLYAQGSNNVHWNPSLAEGDDFWVTCKTGKTLPVRGSFSTLDFPNPHIECRPPSTMVDYRDSLAGISVPVIAHEVGEYEVSPDFREIPKYTGVLKARNLETFRRRLQAAGMLDQAQDFVRASGALSVICYREDIEAALRTPGLGGFQLLDLQDFPGQGTALIGILNVFMESKGLIAPEAWRRFCCETVPLVRMKKYTWTTDETLTGQVQVAHYGPADLPDARVTWTVSDSAGRKVASGAFAPVTIAQGRLSEIDRFALPLGKIAPPEKLTISVVIERTKYRNDYEIWAYPPKVDTRLPPGVLVADDLAAPATRKHLEAGGRVLLLPKVDRLRGAVPGGFQTDFWSPMFAEAAKRQHAETPPGTLGILCDPDAPALARFPTEFHSNWQWWRLVKSSRPIILDATPAGYRPIVQVIDNFARNHKLGLIFEAKIGKGKLLVCAIDLPGLQGYPEARQLYHSLLCYAASDAFAPATELNRDLLNSLTEAGGCGPGSSLTPSRGAERAGISETKRSAPNIVILLADDMGFSDAGCYGSEIGTPNLDALAAGGLRFTEFYNTARCWPSRACILTGYYAQAVRRDSMPGMAGGINGVRPPWARLLPEYLKPLGYRCYHSGKWHVDGSPPANGFDHSFDVNAQGQDNYFQSGATEDGRPVPQTPGYYATTAIADHAIRCLREHADKHSKTPFFLYCAFTSPHFPLQAPVADIALYRDAYLAGWDDMRQRRYDRMRKLGIVDCRLSLLEPQMWPSYNLSEQKMRELIGPGEVGRARSWDALTAEQKKFQPVKMAIHAAMVHRMDAEIGRLIGQLKTMNAWDNTAIFFLSDNGASAEQIIRGGGHDPKAPPGSARTFLCLGPGWSSAANTPLRLHKSWVHEGGISTPLIVHWPAGIKARGELRRNPGHITDLTPTILELAGGQWPRTFGGSPVPPPHGKSLVPVFARDGTLQHDYFWWCHVGNRALRVGNWKIVACKDGPWELYDLDNDRSETQNLAAAQPERVRELERVWSKRADEFRALAQPGQSPTVTPETEPLNTD